MEGRNALYFLVVLTLLAASPALAAGTRLPCPSLFHLFSMEKDLLLIVSIHPSMSFFPRREMRARAILLPDMHGLALRAGVRQPEPGHEGQGGLLHRQGDQALLPLYHML